VKLGNFTALTFRRRGAYSTGSPEDGTRRTMTGMAK
jgi:hypothetical protein